MAHPYPAYKVEYSGGESREHAGKPCDYMYVWLPNPDLEFDEFADDEIEFYAELLIDYEINTPEDETRSYEPLKAEIIRQAVAAKIDPAKLKFWYD